MDLAQTKYPFEVSYEEIEAAPEPFISAIFSCLESEFLILPKGDGFVEYPVFEQAYETLKRTTGGFNVSGNFSALLTEPIKIRTERISGEVLLPETGREELDLKGGMGIDALQHIDEVDIGINSL